MGGLSVRPFSGWARNLEAVQKWQNAGAGGDSGMCRRSTDEAAGCWFTRGLGGMYCCLLFGVVVVVAEFPLFLW